MSRPLKPFTAYTHSPAKMFPSPDFTTLIILRLISDTLETITISTALLISYHEQCLQKQ